MPRFQHTNRYFLYLIFTSIFVFLPTFPALAATAKPQEDKIRSVIQQQLDAFNREDYGTAYLFASRHIQDKFSGLEFERMVKDGYPQIARSSRAMFDSISVSDTESDAVATLTITGRDRITITANYRMVREEGNWKIDGVMVLHEQTPIFYKPS